MDTNGERDDKTAEEKQAWERTKTVGEEHAEERTRKRTQPGCDESSPKHSKVPRKFGNLGMLGHTFERANQAEA